MQCGSSNVFGFFLVYDGFVTVTAARSLPALENIGSCLFVVLISCCRCNHLLFGDTEMVTTQPSVALCSETHFLHHACVEQLETTDMDSNLEAAADLCVLL